MELAELLEKHAPEVRRSLAGQVPQRWQAMLSVDDVMQQTFTDAFLGYATFVPCGDRAFAAWLKKLARNNVVDAVRGLEAEKRGGPRRSGPVTDESFVSLRDLVLGGSGTTPSQNAVRAEAAAALRAAIERLPETHRRVVSLYDLEGRPVADVAHALGRSPGAVYLLRNRAHRRLRELLDGDVRFSSGST